MQPRAISRGLLSVILLLPALVSVFVPTSPASAAPDLDVTVSGPDSVLIGENADLTVTVTNNTATPGYNTGIAVVLPAGVSFVSSSQGGVTQPNTPSAGETTVWFQNVNDSQPASSETLTLQVAANPATFPVGDSFDVTATAFTSDDPRVVPTSAGVGSTGTGTDTTTVDVTAITITKTEPSPEAELLRGVHDHSTVYTLEIENNPTNPTDNVVVDDYLPAGLEFLACGTVDNTTDAPTFAGNNVEYAGAARLDVSTPDLVVDCPAATLVETVELDPDGTGPLPFAVYTHVRWSIGNHAPGATTTITYAAGIPIRENTLTWSGATPATTGAQAANLDNNSGAETADEQLLQNLAMVAGDYQGPLDAGASNPVGDTDTYEVTAEDIRLLKSVNPTNVSQNTITTWTLTVATSEYRTVTNLDITDTLPDGHCPLGATNFDSSDSSGECDPTGDNPSIGYTSVTENSDGTWTLFWDDAATMTASDTLVLTFPSRVRVFYQETGADAAPVVTGDGFVNNVSLTADDHLIAGIPADEADGTTDIDASSASQTANGPAIEKTVSVPAAPGATLDCNTATYVPAETLGSAPFAYRPGDIVCYTLRVEVPANLTFRNSLVTDFLPDGVTFLADLGPTGNNDITDYNGALDFTDGTTAGVGDSTLTYELGTNVIDGARYLPISATPRVWEVRFSAEFTGAPTGDGSSLQKANLMKLTTQTTSGAAISLRDQSTFIAVEPELTIDKSTTATQVAGADTADFTVTVANVADAGSDAGYAAAENISVTDVLPAPFVCADVAVDAVAGTSNSCAADTITWTITSLDAAASIDLTYTLTVPDTVTPSRTYINTATIVSFEQPNNDGGTTNYTPGVSDTASITTPDAIIEKRQVSAVDEAGNGSNGTFATTNDYATIGETITYEVTVDIPEGTTVYNAELRDILPSEVTQVAASHAYTFDANTGDASPGTALPTAGITVNSGDDLIVDFPSTFTNPAGSGTDRVTFTFDVTVNDDANVAGDMIHNRSRFRWRLSPGGTLITDHSSFRSTHIVEPDPQITKGDDTVGAVGAGETVTYTLSIANPTAAGDVSVAHGLEVVDQVPPRIEPVTPIPDGGVWNSGARTITWNAGTTAALASQDPGAAAIVLTYDAVTQNPIPAGGSIDNTATVTASSMAGTVTGERTTYSDNDVNSIPTVSATLTKALSPDTAPYTIGETVTYQLVDTVPQETVAFDHTVTDLVPDGVVFDSATITAGPGCSITGDSAVSNPALILTETQADGSTLVAFFLGDIAAPTTDCVFTIDTVTHVDSTYDGTGSPTAGTPVAVGDSLTNTAQSHWMYSDTVVVTPTTPGNLPGTWDSQTPTATETFVVSEPELAIDKDVATVAGCDTTADATDTDDDACVVTPGHGTLTYTLTVENVGDEPAHDLVVTDMPDAELENVVLGTGSADNTDGWTAGDPAMSWTHTGPLAPGATVTYTYTADLVASGSLDSTSVVTNTADVPTYFGLDAATRATSPNERTYGSTFGPVTADTVDLTIDFPTLAIAKTVADGSESDEAAVGQSFEWRIAVTNTAGTADAIDVDVNDVLPDNWTYDAGSSQLCSPGCGALGDPTESGSAATGLVLDWTDIADLTPGESVEVRFTATPQTGALTDAGTSTPNPHVNTASATADDASGAGASGDGAYSSGTDTAEGVIYEADVRLDKAILTAGPYLVGQTVTYEVTVTNDGPDAATNVVVDEILDGGHLLFSGTLSVDGSYDSVSGEWTLPATLGNGNSASLQLSVILDHAGSITNTAQVVSADRHDPDSTPGNSVGTEDDQDSVTIVTDTASLGTTVWFDVDNSGGDETTKGTEPGFTGVTLTLESQGNDGTFGTADDFFGPDGVAGGGDDIAVTTAVTDANGNYAFTDLPDGSYRVVVDTATLPGGAAGWAQTFDDNGSMDATSGVIVLNAASNSYVDADFSFTGAGSLGDQVWWDVDNSADGVFDNSAFPGAQDQALAGIDVDLTWAGFDGTFGTADDLTYTTDTTDAAGVYGFGDLAPGEYRATVDGSHLPTGLVTQTWDVVNTAPGGVDGDPALVVDVTLGAGQDRTDVDFSFTGDASLGDQLWLDVDADGVFDAGEPGIGGVTVTAVWHGPDGVLGGGDDLTLTTETAADGTYGFDNLPAGDFTVTVDTADPEFPAGVVPTFDLDGIGTADVAVASLAIGEDRTDVDFGYTGTAAVGDLVWLDLDADGTIAGPEVGLPSVDLLVTWAGVDGTFGTADDLTVPTSTDVDGRYGVGNLPFGDVQVQVVTASLPADLVATHDLDGTLDDVATVTLTGGTPVRLDLDFGYRGTAAIGDLVWVDDDADFVVDGTEDAQSGVTVELRHAGADGTIDTADDLVLTDVTDAAGDYGFTNLPAGDVRVTLTAGIPADMTVVSELDGITDAVHETSLSTGQVRDDVDFGLRVDADLAVTKNHSDDFEVNATGRYRIEVVNNGPATAVAATIADALPTGLTFVSATNATCALEAGTANPGGDGGTVTCDLGDLVDGQTATVDLVVDVSIAAAPGVVNTVSVSSDTADRDPSNDDDEDPTEVPLAQLELTKALLGPLDPGRDAVYRLTVVNHGPSPATQVEILDALPNGLSFVSAGGIGWSCSATNGDVTCALAGDLAVGAASVLDLTTRVATGATGSITNVAVVSTPTPQVILADDTARVSGTIVTQTSLPNTGGDATRFLPFGFGLLLMGALLLAGSRRNLATVPVRRD